MSAHEIHGLTRKIAMQMLARHGIVLTVGVYAIAAGDNKRATEVAGEGFAQTLKS